MDGTITNDHTLYKDSELFSIDKGFYTPNRTYLKGDTACTLIPGTSHVTDVSVNHPFSQNKGRHYHGLQKNHLDASQPNNLTTKGTCKQASDRGRLSTNLPTTVDELSAADLLTRPTKVDDTHHPLSHDNALTPTKVEEKYELRHNSAFASTKMEGNHKLLKQVIIQDSPHVIGEPREKEVNEQSPKVPLSQTNELIHHASRIKKFWPNITQQATVKFPEFAALYNTIKEAKTPNYAGARIPLQSGLNINTWRSYLRSYHDVALCDYLEFGWPIGYHADAPPATTHKNHPSGEQHNEHVNRFIEKELSCNAILGPFTDLPFEPWTRISPIMTRPKRESEERRIIIDLSFPRGEAVNDGIRMDNHFGSDISYLLPTITDFAERLLDQGQGAWLWKSDLTRAYRQFRVDPLDCPFMGLKVGSDIYLDLCPPFGCRSSAAICQRVATALVYIMAARGHHMSAYLDDFGGCHRSKNEAERAFKDFRTITAQLGLTLAEKKSVAPVTKMEWLGYSVDTLDMSITIPTTKLQAVLDDCSTWMNRTRASKTMIQALVGRLVFISNCVRAGRKFTARILMTLRAMGSREWTTIGSEFKADVKWFLEYASTANGVFLLPLNSIKVDIFCDSSLHGGGAHNEASFYKWKYTESHKKTYPSIHHLEAINVLVAFKTLAPKNGNRPVSVCVWTDNMASSLALETGKTKDATLAACAREIWLHAAKFNQTITIRHIAGTQIPLADALSRSSHDTNMAHIAATSVARLGLLETAPVLHGYKFFSPLI